MIGFGRDPDNTGVDIFYDKQTGRIAEIDVHSFDLAIARKVAGSDALLDLMGKSQAAIRDLFGPPQGTTSNGVIYDISLPAGAEGKLMLWDDPVGAINLAWNPSFINVD